MKKIKIGDWVEADNGFGVIVDAFPRYYQDGDVPPGKEVGSFEKYSVIVKRFCSYDFKVRFQLRLMSEKLVSTIRNEDLKKVNKLMPDDAV